MVSCSEEKPLGPFMYETLHLVLLCLKDKRIHPFSSQGENCYIIQEINSVVLSVLTELCNHRHNLEHCPHQERTLVPLSGQPLPVLPPRPPAPGHRSPALGLWGFPTLHTPDGI